MALRDLANRPKPETGTKFAPIDQAVREPISETVLVWGLLLLAAVCIVVVIRHYIQLYREKKKEEIRLRLLAERGELHPLEKKPTQESEHPSPSLTPPSPAEVSAESPHPPQVSSEGSLATGFEAVDLRAVTVVEPSSPPTDGTTPLGTTRHLQTGTKVRLHFAQAEGTFPCTVIHVSEEGFVVTLPKVGGKHHHPHEGEKVEGFATIQNGFGIFQSHVHEVFHGGIFACRIAHSDAVKVIHKRSSLRVPVDCPITFAHYATAGLHPEDIPMERLGEFLRARWEGRLKDLSLGGCAIATASRHRFAPGDMVEFPFSILPDEPVCTLRGTILRARPIPSEEGNGMFLQVRFLPLEESVQGTLERTVHHISEHPLRTRVAS